MPTKWQNGRTCSSAVVQFDLLIVGRKVIDESPSPHTKFSCQQQSKHVVSAAATPTPTPPPAQPTASNCGRCRVH